MTPPPVLYDRLVALDEQHAAAFGEIRDGATGLPAIRDLAEHVANMAATLSNMTLTVNQAVKPHLTQVVERATTDPKVERQLLDDAVMYLTHLQHLLEAGEAVGANATALLAKAAAAGLG
jgi:hypothetical protein